MSNSCLSSKQSFMSNTHQDFSPNQSFPICISPDCPFQMHKFACDQKAPCDCPHMDEAIYEMERIDYEKQSRLENMEKPKVNDLPRSLVLEMAKLYLEGTSCAKIAREYGLTRYLVWRAFNLYGFLRA